MPLAKRKNWTSQRGATLVSTLVAVGIGGIVTGTTMKVMSDNIRVAAGIEDRNEIQAIRLRLGSEIDCPSTLNMTSATALSACPATFLQPQGRSGKGVYPLTTGAVGTGSFANSYQVFGDWWLRTECVANLGLRVSVAKRTGNTFVVDKITNRNLDFSNVIFGGADNLPLCRDFINGAVTKAVSTCSPGKDSAGNNIFGFIKTFFSEDATGCEEAQSSNMETAALAPILGPKIMDNAITPAKIADGSIQGIDIGAGQITAGKIGSSQITSGKLQPSSVTNPDFALNTLAGGDFADGAVAAVDLAVGALNTNHIAPDAVDTIDFSPGAVALADVADGAVNNAVLVEDGKVQGVDFAEDSITNPLIVGMTFTTNRLAPGGTLGTGVTGADIFDFSLDHSHFDASPAQTPAFQGYHIAWFGLDEGRIFKNASVGNVDLSPQSFTPDKLNLTCQDGEILRWSDAVSNWICGGQPEVQIAIAKIRAMGSAGSYLPTTRTVVAGPTDIWTNYRFIQGGNTLDGIGCNAKPGWKVVNCFVYSTDYFNSYMLQKHKNNPMSGPGAADPTATNYVTWFDRDSSLYIATNRCATNDMSQGFEGLSGIPDFRINYTNYWYDLYAVCVKED